MPVTLPFVDDFTRADAPSLGAPWVAELGQMGIVTNTAMLTQSGTIFGSQAVIVTVDTGVLDQVVEVVPAPYGQNTASPVVRYSDNGHFIMMDTRQDHGVFDVVDSVPTNMLTIVSVDGDTLKLSVTGTTVEAFVNGVSQGTYTTSVTAGTMTGVFGYADNGQSLTTAMKHFSVDEIGGSPVPGVIASISGTGASGPIAPNQRAAVSFTPTGDMTVNTLSFTGWDATTGIFRIGIATDVGAGDPTWLGYEDITNPAGPTATGTFGAAVTLTGGTMYYCTCIMQSGSGGGEIYVTTDGSTVTVGGVFGDMYWGTADTTENVLAGYFFAMSLTGTSVSGGVALAAVVSGLATVTAEMGVLLGDTGRSTSSSRAGDYTFVFDDAGYVVEYIGSGAGTFTIPTNADVAFPLGTVINVCATTTGVLTIAAAGGVTLDSLGGKVALSGQWAHASLRQRVIDEWVLVGALA